MMAAVSRQIVLLCALAMTLMAVSCSDHIDAPKKPTRRTVLVYIAADNNLSYFVQDDINEMIQGSIDIPSDYRLIVYCDNYANTCIYEIKNNDRKLLYTYPDQQCSASTDVLREVIERATTLAPAESYGLVLWSHGSGCVPGNHIEHDASVPPMQRSILHESHGRKTCTMSVEELAEVLDAGPRFEYILFDACLMQNIESDYALRHVTDYIVATPAETPGRGGTYNLLIAPMFASPFDADALAQAYYQGEADYWNRHNRQQGGIVISAVRTDQLDSLARVTRKLTNATPVPLNYVEYADMLTINPDVQFYWCYDTYASSLIADFVDLKSLMLVHAGSPHWDEWLQQLDRTVTSCHALQSWDSQCASFSNRGQINNPDNICGLSIFAPSPRYRDRTWNDQIPHQTAWWQDVFN